MSKYTLYGICLQVIFAAMVLADDASAQRYSVNDIYLEIDLENVSLEEAFKRIESSTEFSFNYNEFILNKEKKITLKTKNKSLGDLLKDFSKNSDLQFKRVNETIHVISKSRNNKPVTEVFIDNSVDVEVSGQVSDENGQALPGASIVVKGASIGTTTDLNGNYKLTVSDDANLTISFVGYKTLDIPIGGRSTIDIQMELDAEQLEEIVVVGYGTQKRAEVTGAISSIGSDVISQVPITTAEQALQGRAAGVTLVSNGSPGSAPIIRVRGLGTVNDNAPLIVIDGVVGARLQDLNPGDIESMQVLKDASTTAIYGALGANGVIMVTTKKGASGAPKVTFETWQGVQTQNKSYDVLNTQQYIQYARDWGAIPGGSVPARITDPQYSSYLNTDTNWQEEVYQSAEMSNYNIGVSGGTANSNYRISTSYLDQEGVVRSTDFNRFNFRANTNFTLGKLKLGQTLSASINQQKGLNDSGGRSILEHAIKMPPYLKVYNPNNLGGYQGPQSTLDLQDAENPIRILELESRLNKQETLLGSIYAEYEVIDGLKFKTQGGLELRNWDFNSFTPSFDDSQNDGGGQHFSPNGAAITKDGGKTESKIWTNSLSYTKKINDFHTIDIVLVAESQTIDYNEVKVSSTNEITDELNQVSTELASISSLSNRYVREGYVGRVNYNYDGKYMFAASLRRDASSRFGSKNRWGTFPSVAAGWRISEESFLKENNLVSNLKLRASWGKVGNDRIGDYRYSSTLTNNYNYPFGASEGLGIGTTASGPVDANLKWEETSMVNVGLDLGLMQDQLTFSLEYYKNKSDDLLMDQPLPVSTRIHGSSITRNVGSVETSGFEFSAGYNDFEGEFQWSVNVNLGTANNEVQSLGDAESITGGSFENQNISRTVVGESMFHFYGYVMDGIFQTQGDVDGHATQANAEPGDVRFKDISGAPDADGNPTGPDGVIDANDRTIIGNPFPDFTYGINATASYKGFDFNVFFSGVSGNDVYNTNLYDLQGMPRLFNAGAEVLNRWTGPNTSNTIPRLNGAGENVQVSSRFVEDGSFLRVKNISIGYNVPASLLKDKVSKVRIYVSAQNLLTFTSYSGLDPEIGAYVNNNAQDRNSELGIDRGNYPMPMSFVGGIQISF